MQIIEGFMVRTTPAMVPARIRMLASSVACILLDFQSILMNTTLADIAVLCSSRRGDGGWCYNLSQKGIHIHISNIHTNVYRNI